MKGGDVVSPVERNSRRPAPRQPEVSVRIKAECGVGKFEKSGGFLRRARLQRLQKFRRAIVDLIVI